MPSALPLPTVPELEQAFHASVGSERKGEDAHTGSIYDRWGGLGALCGRRIAERDQSEARAIFFDTATDARLDWYISEHFEAERVKGAPGTGLASLSRPSGTAGRLYRGTRIAVGDGSVTPIRYWSATDDYDVGTELSVVLPITAGEIGLEGHIALAAGQGAPMRLVDPLWDNTWTVTRIDCAAGTERQNDAEVRSSIRQSRQDARPGFETAITNAMVAAGSAVVVLYRSDFLGDALDFGLNRIYVGDTGYESPAALLLACRLTVPSVAVAGTSVQVLPMTNALLYVDATVRLWNSPERLNRVQAQSDAVAAITEYFARRDNAFLWSERAMRTAVMGAVQNVHSVTLATWQDSARTIPAPEPTLATLFDSSPLPRFRVADWTVTAAISGPV